MNDQHLIELIEKQKAEIESLKEKVQEMEKLKEKIQKANKLTVASKYVLYASNKFLSDAITKLEVAMKEYDDFTMKN